ncbi:MAG: hydrogenobyrinic acid a,c-diamide synthase (glutamine-hydrolyzing) [Syntrophobacterales bacterium]|nr:hydrogenobyrinic acid a,c-diamide synthase (glutamine-hydrolyzing) [Syntrophobacterales bacterium]
MKNSIQKNCSTGLERPHGFIIAAVKGGSGKTFVSVGLLAALKYLGYNVTPFKKGPDYIDAGWLAAAAGGTCYNLDPFLMSRKDIVVSFCSRIARSDMAIVEGNRGLFDGLDDDGSCSTAELAKILDLPIILIIDVTKMTRTTAAIVYGCRHFDKDLNIVGIILNQVGTSRQEELIRRVVEKTCNVPVVGAIPRLSRNLFPERHLGLVPTPEHGSLSKAIDYARKIIEKSLELEKILSLSKPVSLCSIDENKPDISKLKHSDVTIGVIRDEAFQFYYPENFEALERAGARLEFLSALKDKHLPLEIDGLYIGGGFPEVYAEALAENKSFKAELRDAIDRGMPVYAECGGLMYLSEHIRKDERNFPMVGVFPLAVEMRKKPQGHGYVVGQVIRENPFLPVGLSIRAHEFHYSKAFLRREEKDIGFVVGLHKGHGIVEQFDGIMYKNCVALYAHIHALACKEWAVNFVAAAQTYRIEKSMKPGGIERFNLSAVNDQKCNV